MNDAGRIGFVIKGDYSSSTTYEFLDVVYYQNATYIARKTTTGVLPTVTTDWFCAVDADVNGLVHACTINPNASADYAADWLMENGAVVTPGSNDLYRVVVGGKDRLFFYNGTQYELVAGGGHTILNASTLPMAGRDNLQFENVKVVDDPTNNKTIIKPQFHVCATEAEWNAMSPAEQNDPLVYWVRPWANSDAFATDRTPVGTVISVAGTYNYTTHTPTGRFPSNDYLVCNGATIVDGKNVSKQTFPKLAEYFQEAYGNFQYFGTGGGGTDEFSLPNWELDFPEDNGILCIKAQISSTAITYHEIDQSGIYAGTDKVPSCARVAEIEEELGDALDGDITYLNTLKYNVNILSYTQASPYTAPSDGYVLAAGGTSGTGSIVLAGSLLRVTVPANGYFSIFVKKGLTIYGEGLSAMAFRAFNRA